MKGLCLAGLMMAAVQAASTRSFVEGVGENGTSGQFVRVAKGSANAVIGVTENTKAGDDIYWEMTTYSVYYEDSGETKIRIVH